MTTAAVTLIPSRDSVPQGQPFALRWVTTTDGTTTTATSTSGAQTTSPSSPDVCNAAGGWSGSKNPYSGSEVVTPDAPGDSMFMLSCGSASASTVVHVTPPLLAGSPELTAADCFGLMAVLSVAFFGMHGYQTGRMR